MSEHQSGDEDATVGTWLLWCLCCLMLILAVVGVLLHISFNGSWAVLFDGIGRQADGYDYSHAHVPSNHWAESFNSFVYFVVAAILLDRMQTQKEKLEELNEKMADGSEQ